MQDILIINKCKFTISLLLFVFISYGQVGIGTTSPYATLDVRSSNQTTPASNDGILIPKIDNFPTINPIAAQNGMLVFVTGNSAPNKGFYYWDNAITNWVPIIGSGSSGGNTLDQAYDQGGLGLGKTINATDGAVRINGEDGFLVTGTFGTGNTIDTEVTGSGTRLFFNPNKAAFRAGRVTGNQWNDTNIGVYSIALGSSTTASGTGSTAFGLNTLASGIGSNAFGQNSIATQNYATAFGEQTSATGYSATSFGNVTTASGYASTAFGNFNTASGMASTVFGLFTTASGLEATAFGFGTIASGDESTAFGYQTTASEFASTSFGNFSVASQLYATAFGTNTQASGVSSTAFGINSTASGTVPFGPALLGGVATAFGINTTASGSISTSFGSGTIASGGASTAFGNNTEASGDISTAFGSNNTASAYSATAFGINNVASNLMSTAFGQENEATGVASTAFGQDTQATGINSTAFGFNTMASSAQATAFGQNSIASGYASTALGIETIAPSSYETTIGSFNTIYTPMVSGLGYDLQDRIFVVGNGIDNTQRSNALTIYKSGLININDAYDMPLADGVVNQVLATNGNGVVSFQDANILNGNTLDEAYDEGGFGAGRIINATNGPLEIQGNGGLIVESANQTHMLFVDGVNDAISIGTNSPTANLSVNGTVNKPGGGTWAVFSDERLKENIHNYNQGLELITKVRPINFSYNIKMKSLLGENASLDNRTYQGVIAQELQKIAPDMVREVALGSEHFLEVDPNKFVYALINAVQEQQYMIEEQQKIIDDQQHIIKTHSVKIKYLETQLKK